MMKIYSSSTTSVPSAAVVIDLGVAVVALYCCSAHHAVADRGLLKKPAFLKHFQPVRELIDQVETAFSFPAQHLQFQEPVGRNVHHRFLLHQHHHHLLFPCWHFLSCSLFFSTFLLSLMCSTEKMERENRSLLEVAALRWSGLLKKIYCCFCGRHFARSLSASSSSYPCHFYLHCCCWKKRFQHCPRQEKDPPAPPCWARARAPGRAGGRRSPSGG
mmetsp:Transcript_6175/g.10072  ORF Transcript_6175/g.10072 Transcript_6175/m.10072 type:complete len:216 (+) Transcript_6175:3-650(+)